MQPVSAHSIKLFLANSRPHFLQCRDRRMSAPPAISANLLRMGRSRKCGNELFTLNNHEDRWSEHGLGHLRNLRDFESDDRDWIREAWLFIIRTALRLPTEPLGSEHLPAVGRVTITSPKVMRTLTKLNRGKGHRRHSSGTVQDHPRCESPSSTSWPDFRRG